MQFANCKSIERYQFFLLVESIILILLLSACQPAYMEVSPRLSAQGYKMPVVGRQSFSFSRLFSFGPYKVTKVDGGLKSSSSSKFFSETSHIKEKNDFTFNLLESSAIQWTCDCKIRSEYKQTKEEHSNGITSISEFDDHILFTGTFIQRRQNIKWQLTMKQGSRRSGTMKGALTYGNTRVDVISTNKWGNCPFEPSSHSGYQFFINGNEMGAVEVINKGSVWFHNSADPYLRSALANASAALLLYYDLYSINL